MSLSLSTDTAIQIHIIYRRFLVNVISILRISSSDLLKTLQDAIIEALMSKRSIY